MAAGLADVALIAFLGGWVACGFVFGYILRGAVERVGGEIVAFKQLWAKRKGRVGK